EGIKTKKSADFSANFSRKEGIRTLDTVTRILPFQGSLFNHSSTFLCEELDANLLTFSFKTNRFIAWFRFILSSDYFILLQPRYIQHKPVQVSVFNKRN